MIHELPPQSPSATVKTILNQEGITAALSLIGPGEELPKTDAATDRVLFVVDGAVNVQLDDLNFLLNKDQALYIARDKFVTIRHQGDGWAKLLRIDLPNRTVVAAPIFSVPDGSALADVMAGR